jgi:asparagine synthase (glutamine-hydrolysing)
MCAILGVLSLTEPIQPESVLAAVDAVRHRGPDDEGFVAVNVDASTWRVTPLAGKDSSTRHVRIQDHKDSSRLFLAHRRLSILDLSSAGHQPMHYREKLWLVFNGEIYNYVELRDVLSAKGYRFESNSDTEVVLAAYAHWGEDCVKHFNGDWAFCILDLERRLLFLSRDRFGVKPLFYFNDGEQIAFASELKALLQLPRVTRRLDADVAGDYLSLLTLDDGEGTFFDGVRRLLPAHSMRVDVATGEIVTWRYYDLKANESSEAFDDGKARAHALQIRELLTDAIRIRMRADVPVGTCLSGGVDSSAVVAIAASLNGDSDRRPQVFTACFPGESIDEEVYARQVATHVGAEGHYVYPTQSRCLATLTDVIAHQDEPFGGAALCAQWDVMQEASRHVKVVLDGQGGDEVFGGYRNQRLAYLAQLWIERRYRLLLQETSAIAGQASNFRAAVAELKTLPAFLLPAALKLRLYNRRTLARRQLPATGARSRQIADLFIGNLNRQLLHDMTRATLPHLLRFEDRNSMAHSIEARVPFTDHRLVDYVFGIPGSFKIHNGWTKYLLRLAVEPLLPPEIVWRKTKVGFTAPRWVTREDIWKRWAQAHRFETTRVSPLTVRS